MYLSSPHITSCCEHVLQMLQKCRLLRPKITFPIYIATVLLRFSIPNLVKKKACNCLAVKSSAMAN